MEVTLRDILPEAYKEHRVILQFNIHTLEDVVGIIEAGYELDLPVIVACTPIILNQLGGRSIVGVYRSLADYCSTPIVLHLDRAVDLKDAWRAISLGFTSVMIDGSNMTYEENVKLTSTVVEVARAAGISVEGKITSKTKEGYEITEPDLAYSFLLETEIDALEVAVKKANLIDFETLERINRTLKIPLALRKEPEMSTEDIKQSVVLGITKVSIEEKTPPVVTGIYRDIVFREKERLKERVKELISNIGGVLEE